VGGTEIKYVNKYYTPKNTTGLERGYKIWQENLRGKSMPLVRQISRPYCTSRECNSTCNQVSSTCMTSLLLCHMSKWLDKIARPVNV